MSPLLYEAGLIQNQYTNRIAKTLDHMIAADISRIVSVPGTTSEHRLHPPRNLIAGVFGQLPAVLALNTTDQAVEIKPDLPACLRTLEYASKAGFQFRQLRPPRQHRRTSNGHAILTGEIESPAG